MPHIQHARIVSSYDSSDCRYLIGGILVAKPLSRNETTELISGVACIVLNTHHTLRAILSHNPGLPTGSWRKRCLTDVKKLVCVEPLKLATRMLQSSSGEGSMKMETCLALCAGIASRQRQVT